MRHALSSTLCVPAPPSYARQSYRKQQKQTKNNSHAISVISVVKPENRPLAGVAAGPRRPPRQSAISCESCDHCRGQSDPRAGRPRHEGRALFATCSNGTGATPRSGRCSAKRWTRSSPAATRSSCCRPAAASRSASRRRRSSRDGLAVVVSPLISLMKDQVDTLVGNGVPAALHQQLAVAGSARASVTAGCATDAIGCCTSRPSGWSARAATPSRPGCRRATSASSPSTRRTASASGGTTSAPNTGSSVAAGAVPRRQPPRLHRDRDRTRPARHRVAARRCRSPSSWSDRSIGRTSSTASCRART